MAKEESKNKEKKNVKTEKSAVKEKTSKEKNSEYLEREIKKELDAKKASKKQEVVVLGEEFVVENKKKINTGDIVLVIGLVLILILGFFMLKGEKMEPTYELPLAITGEAGLQELTYAEYQEKVDNDEAFVLIIERATCSHCVNFMPVAESFASDNGLPLYYVDTDTFTSDDWEGFQTSNTYLKKNSDSWGTPTTLVLAGNEAIDSIVGETTADELLELYEEYFEMNEE